MRLDTLRCHSFSFVHARTSKLLRCASDAASDAAEARSILDRMACTPPPEEQQSPEKDKHDPEHKVE